MPSSTAKRFSVAGKAKSSARNRVSRAGKTSFPPDIAVEIDITKDSLFKFHIYAALKEPLRWTRARSSDRAKRSRRSAKASPSSILLLGNHGRRRGNHVSCAGKAESHAGNCFSRAGKAKSRAGNHVSRAGKAKSHAGNCFSRAGKAKFHAGIPFTCVSALANTITIVGSSCLGRKFRLDEPLGKKNFRKRTLQDVVPAPPSVKDQAFDQQCIEEHHE